MGTVHDLSWFLSRGFDLQSAAYFAAGSKRAVSVYAEKPYVLVAEFEDGVRKRYDWAHDLTGVLACLTDYDLFRRAYIDEDGCVAWDGPNGHIDTSADTVYIYGQTVT